MKFGVREICDVVFKATANNQKIGQKTFKKGQPCFMIDTAKTSSLEQATTTVYAQGGKGNNRLIAWEGEKTMTFTVEDALISPMGLAVLSGAGLINPDKKNVSHVHITVNKMTNSTGVAEVDLDDLREETGLNTATSFIVCGVIPAYATILDGSGAGIDWISDVTISGTKATEDASEGHEDYKVDKDTVAKFTLKDSAGQTVNGKTVQLDFYLIMTTGVTEVEIKPEDFGGYFYVEAQTLFRREDDGQDMAAEIILPRVKVQSGFTFSMASSGDPSTFTFTMDAFPGYTQFDSTKKVMCVMQVIGTDNLGNDSDSVHATQHGTLAKDTPDYTVTQAEEEGQIVP